MGKEDQLTKVLRRPLEVVSFQVAAGLIPLLPRKAVLLLAKAAGTLSCHLSGRERRVGLANLDVVFGESKSAAEKKAILKQSLVSFSLTMLDIFWFSSHTAQRLGKYHRFDPETGPYFDKRAYVVITAHAGNWELIALASSVSGVDMAAIAAVTKNPRVDKQLNKLRQAAGLTIIPREGAMRSLIARLRKKEKAGFVLDQNTKVAEGGVWVDFLGMPTPVSAAPAHLAYRTGTEVIFAFSQPLEDGRFVTRLGPVITPPAFDAKQDKDTIVHELTQQIMDVVSTHIRENPESWLWAYKHWRYVAPGDSRENYPNYK